MAEVTTDDVVNLRTVLARVDDLRQSMAVAHNELAEMRQRLARVERAGAGGSRLMRRIERLILATITALLGYQTVEHARTQKAVERVEKTVEPRGRGSEPEEPRGRGSEPEEPRGRGSEEKTP